MMCVLDKPWFRLCLCRNLYRDLPPLGGHESIQDATEAADKAGRDEGSR